MTELGPISWARQSSDPAPGEEECPLRHNFGPVLGRIAAIIAGLLAFGLAWRFCAAVLTPVLPEPVSSALLAGWTLFYSAVRLAIPAVVAVGVLCAIGWVALGFGK